MPKLRLFPSLSAKTPMILGMRLTSEKQIECQGMSKAAISTQRPPIAMKRFSRLVYSGASLLALVCMTGTASHLQAQTGTWNIDNNGNWSAAANWTGGVPNGIDHIANLTNNISAARTLTIDAAIPGTNVTLGTLNIGDSNGTHGFTISGGRITFDVTSGSAQLNLNAQGQNNTISSAITLNDQLDITIADVDNHQGTNLTGIIGGGTNGTTAISFTDTSAPTPTNGSLNWILLNGANTYLGQLVINSGLVRYESAGARGATGVGNETIVLSGGAVDLRNQNFTPNSDTTEIFTIAGTGPNGLGALRNTTGTAYLGHLILTDNAIVNSQSAIVLERRLNTAGNATVAPILDFGAGKFNMTKIGANDFVIRGANILNANGAQLTINEGEVRFESRGPQTGGGAPNGGINLDGLTVNLSYNKNPYNNVDLSQGSRTTNDLYSVPINQTAIQGNTAVDARFSIGSMWGASVTGTGTLAEQTKETLTFNNMTFNFNNGLLQREGNGEVGRTFDHIYNNVTINLLGGSVRPNATGYGNRFDLTGGSGAYNSTTGQFDHPGLTELRGNINGAASTGFIVRGDRELRLTGANAGFSGEVYLQQNTGRFLSFNINPSMNIAGANAPMEAQYASMGLAGALGSLSNATSITLERWGSLALWNNQVSPSGEAAANNNNRLNDAGFLNFSNGNLVIQTNASVANTENIGNVRINMGASSIYIDPRAGGNFNGGAASLSLAEGAVLKIINLDSSKNFGGAGSAVSFQITGATPAVVGGALGSNAANIIPGIFGGNLPTFTSNTVISGTGYNYTRSSTTVANSIAFRGSGLSLMTMDGGYLRPLTASEYAVGMAPVANSNWLVNGYAAAGTYSDRANYASRIDTNTTVNSLTIGFNAATSGQAIPTADRDYIIMNPLATLKINSGVINFANYAETINANMQSWIRGGFLDMNGKVAIINSGASWQDTDRNTAFWYEFNTGNSSYINSHIQNATGLIKTGGNNLYLNTSNQISGNIYVTDQSSLIVRHSEGLGAGAPGREVIVTGTGNFAMEYGTDISGIDLRIKLTAGSQVGLRHEGQAHGVWRGNVIYDNFDMTGGSQGQSALLTARTNGTLSIYGNIYTANNQSITDNDLINDPPIISTNIGESHTLNLRGQFRDVETGNLRTDPAYAGITSVFRTGDSATRLDSNHSLRFQMLGHDEVNVNVFQQWDATGRIDLNRGYFRVLYDPATSPAGSGFLTDGARALITSNDYFNRVQLGGDGTSTTANDHAHLSLTRDNQLFNAPYIYIYNNNRLGTVTLMGENETGTVYWGSRLNDTNFSMQIANQNTEKDIRFLQVRGGTTVFNGRLDDENDTQGANNMTISMVGAGNYVFNRNSIGASDIDRWNFLAGETHWGTMVGNNEFAKASGAVSTWGAGGIVLDAQAASRTQTLDGNIFLLNGSGYATVNQNTIFTVGAAAAVLARRSGSSLSFYENGNGAINFSASGLTTTADAFLATWATYGSTATGITDWAAREGTTGVKAFAGYVGTFGAGSHTNLTSVAPLAANTVTDTLRLAAGSGVTLSGGSSLTLNQGGILIPNGNASNINISGGTLTSAWASGSYDLILNHYGQGTANVSSVITNNGSNKVNLVVNGTGTTVLQSDNTFTGEHYLNGGILEISNEAQLGNISGSVSRLSRVNNGGSNVANLTNSAFTVSGGTGTGFAATFSTDGNQAVTGTTLTSGGSGYTNGIFLSTTATLGTGTAAVWAIFDSGNLRFNGGTLKVTDNMVLNGGRTIFLGAEGGTLNVSAGKTLTINGYITSELSHVTGPNGYGTINHLGVNDEQASNRNPDIGDLIVEGGGTINLTGAPDGTIRANMYNSYGGITWINNGTLRLAGSGSSIAAQLGTNRSFVDGTIIGANGSLEFAANSEGTLYDWLTVRGTGYLGGGTIRTSRNGVNAGGTQFNIAGQTKLESDMFIHMMDGANVYLQRFGGDMFGSGNVIKAGTGILRFYGYIPEWTGSLISSGGETSFYDQGGAPLMTSMTLDRNTYFAYNADTTTVDEFRNRFADNLPITTNGYVRLRMDSTSGVFSGYERVGKLTVAGGQVGIEYNLGADVFGSVSRLTGDYAGWWFDEIIRNPGTTVSVRNLDGGTGYANASSSLSGLTNLNNRAILQVTNAPALVGSGDGSNGNTPIAKGFFGGTRLEWYGASNAVRFNEDYIAHRLMTVDTSVNGEKFVRPLVDSDYRTLSSPDTAITTILRLEDQAIGADQNLRIVGVTSDTDYTNLAGGGLITSRRDSLISLNAQQTVNSLNFESETFVNGTNNPNGWGNYTGITMTDNAELTITSGTISMFNRGVVNFNGRTVDTGQNLDIRSAIQGGRVNMAGGEAIFNFNSLWAPFNTAGNPAGFDATDFDNNFMWFASSLVNTTNIVKTGGASVIFTAPNFNTGDVYINQGYIYAGHDKSLGAATKVFIDGAGQFSARYGAKFNNIDLVVGKLQANNIVMQLEDTSYWGGKIIIDNVDASGVTSYGRNYTPRIITNSTAIGTIAGDIIGGPTALRSGLGSEARIFSTYTGAAGILDIRGTVRDSAAGAVAGPVTEMNQNQVLRMEVSANNNEATVQLNQAYDSAGSINLVRGILRYNGTGNFYTAAAAAAVNSNPLNPMLGLNMGGRSVLAADGENAANISFTLAKAGAAFNLSSWEVGGESYDPFNTSGNDNYGRSNITGNTMLGGENISGAVTFGTGAGSIIFTPNREFAVTAITTTGGSTSASVTSVTNLYVGMYLSGPNIAPGTYVRAISGTTLTLSQAALSTTGSGAQLAAVSFAGTDRDLRLYAATGGTVNILNNFQDGGSLVNSSITKLGGGTVNLQGSSAGDSTVESVNVLGGILNLENYGVNTNRRVGNGAKLLMGGGTLFVNGTTGTADEDFSTLRIIGGGSTLAATGSTTVDITGSFTRSTGGSLHFQSNSGAVIRATGIAANTRIGSYATFGAGTGTAITATSWAATNASGVIGVFTGYSTSFGAGNHTDAQTAMVGGSAASLRFDTTAASIASGAVNLSDGGVLVTSNRGAGTILASGASLTSGSAGTDLVIHNYATGDITLAGSIIGGQPVVFTGTGRTILTNAGNTYTGVTSVTGTSILSFSDVAVLGTNASMNLNGGTLEFTATGSTSAGTSNTLLKNIVLGGSNGTIRVTTANNELVLKGTISSEVNNVIDTYAINANNPNNGGISYVGPGRVQFGDRTAAGGVQSLDGINHTYTGLTLVGDGINPFTFDLQGQPNENLNITPFGSTDGWADGTIFRNNSTFEFGVRFGDVDRDGQARIREWIQFGETASDQIYFNNTTGRNPAFDGTLNVVGTLNVYSQTGSYGDNGSTGNGEVLINPNEGGLYGTGDIIKRGNGNIRFYKAPHTWTGNLDLRDGFTGIQANNGEFFESTGKIFMGAATLQDNPDNSGIQMRIENRIFGNGNIQIDAPNFDITISRDIEVRNNLTSGQQITIASGYMGKDSIIHFTGNINLGSGSLHGGAGGNAQVRFFHEDTTTLDPRYNGGASQHAVFDVAGNLSGSNNLAIDSNEGNVINAAGGTTLADPLAIPAVAANNGLQGNDMFFTVLLRGNNTAYTGNVTVGLETGTGTNNFDRDDIEILRFGSATALSAANNVTLQNLSMLQAGGQSVTIGNLNTVDGNTTTGIYSFTSPTWSPGRETTADLEAKAGGYIDPVTGNIVATDYTPLGDSSAIIENGSAMAGTLKITQNLDATWDVYFRDGVVASKFENTTGPAGSLSIEKLGTGAAVMNIFNDYTGSTTVSSGVLQVGIGGDGVWGTITQGARSVTSATYGGTGIAGSTGTGVTTVGVNGTLTGTGHIRGDLVVQGQLRPGDYNSGTFEAGGVEGTLFVGGPGQVGNVTFQSGSLTTFQIFQATAYDLDLALGNYDMDDPGYFGHVAGIPGSRVGTSVNPTIFGQSGTDLLAGSFHDHLEIGGNVVWQGGTIQVEFTAYTPEPGDIFNLMDWYGLSSNWSSFNVGSSRFLIGNGDDNGNFNLPDLSQWNPELRWDTGLWTQHGILLIAYVPEPSRMMLLVIGVLGYCLRRRRSASGWL